MFPSRCSGIEHFLLRIIKQLPDLEFIVNTRDWPQVNRHFGQPLPIFSFSKVMFSKYIPTHLITSFFFVLFP